MTEQYKAPLKVSDESGRTLNYHLTPASKDRESAPILISYHGWNGVSAAERYAEMNAGMPHWNVVFPMDRWGYNRMGAWFLGLEGDFFIVALITGLVERLRSEYGMMGPIYAYGTSMGGFGAAMNGIRLRLPVLVLDVPQTCLLGNVYGRYHADKLRHVFGAEVVERINAAPSIDELPEDLRHFKPWFDLSTALLETEESYRPTVLLYQSRFDNSDGGTGNSYVPEQTMRLVAALVQRQAPFLLEIENRNGHVTRWNFWRAIKFIDAGVKTREGAEE